MKLYQWGSNSVWLLGFLHFSDLFAYILKILNYWTSIDLFIFFSCHDRGIKLWYRCAVIDLYRQTTTLLLRFWDCPKHSYQNEKDNHIDN